MIERQSESFSSSSMSVLVLDLVVVASVVVVMAGVPDVRTIPSFTFQLFHRVVVRVRVVQVDSDASRERTGRRVSL
jgi:hypothetical protein